MGPEEAAEEILRGPYEACTECKPGELGNLRCGLCHGTNAVLRQRFVDACKQLGCDEVLYKHINAVAHARQRALKLVNEQELYDYIQGLNDKAMQAQAAQELRNREALRQMSRELQHLDDSRKLKR